MIGRLDWRRGWFPFACCYLLTTFGACAPHAKSQAPSRAAQAAGSARSAAVRPSSPLQTPALEAPPAPLPRETLHAALCKGDPKCEVTVVVRTAPLPDGTRTVLVTVPTTPGPPAPCPFIVAWLARVARDDTLLERQLVGGGCAGDSPYGSSCDFAPVLRIADSESPAVTTSAKVAWDTPGPGCGGWSRGTTEAEISLETFEVQRRTVWDARAADPDDSHQRRWDLGARVFTSEWRTSGGDCPARKRGPTRGIPKLTLPPEVEAGRWRDVEMLGCATTFDDATGVSLGGRGKTGAQLNALVSESGALLVDVLEAKGAPAGATLTFCSALWTAEEYDYCHMPLGTDCTTVDLSGRPIASGGAKVERAPERPRFRVELPEDTGALTVIYKNARGNTLASSQFRRDDATSLGHIFWLRPEAATCQLSPEGLRLVPAPRRSDQPLLVDDGFD